MAFSLGDGKRVSFWKDIWCGEEALCLDFPMLYNLADHKDTMVADVWEGSREEGGWLPIFLRSLNDWEMEEVERYLQALHNKKISPLLQDKLLLKGSKARGFLVKFMRMVLDQSLDLAFPFSFNLESSRPSQIGFFSHGKLLGGSC